MVRTQIQLTDAEARALRQLAAERSTSAAALVREGVELVLRARHQPTVQDLRCRAIAAVGRHRSGMKDLATRHDEYFAEASRR